MNLVVRQREGRAGCTRSLSLCNAKAARRRPRVVAAVSFSAYRGTSGSGSARYRSRPARDNLHIRAFYFDNARKAVHCGFVCEVRILMHTRPRPDSPNSDNFAGNLTTPSPSRRAQPDKASHSALHVRYSNRVIQSRNPPSLSFLFYYRIDGNDPNMR